MARDLDAWIEQAQARFNAEYANGLDGFVFQFHIAEERSDFFLRVDGKRLDVRKGTHAIPKLSVTIKSLQHLDFFKPETTSELLENGIVVLSPEDHETFHWLQLLFRNDEASAK